MKSPATGVMAWLAESVMLPSALSSRTSSSITMLRSAVRLINAVPVVVIDWLTVIVSAVSETLPAWVSGALRQRVGPAAGMDGQAHRWAGRR